MKVKDRRENCILLLPFFFYLEKPFKMLLMDRSWFTLFFALLLFSTIPGKAQKLVSADSIEHYTVNEMSNMGLNPENPVTAYRITYLTPRLDSSTDTASGALLIPDLDSCPEGYPLVSYQHGTVMKDENVPSQNGNRQAGLHFASDAYVVSMPDYLGLGSSEGLHPFQHARTEATASLDMMRASKEFVRNSLPFSLDGDVFLTGYSQGGHSTLALHRYIETNSLLDSFDVRISVPMSGPYDLSGVQSELPADSSYASPGYYPYVIASYQKAYGNIYDSLEQIYEAPYDSLIPLYMTGDSTLQSLNNALPSNIYDYMEDSVLDKFYADTNNFSHPIRLDLYENDLYRWGPERMTRLMYCGGDEQVFPENAVVAEDSMNAYGATDVKAELLHSTWGHGNCILLTLSNAKNLFDSARSACNANAIRSPSRSDKELLVRREGRDRWELQAPYRPLRYRLYSIQGKPVMRGSSDRKRFRVHTGHLPRGLYVIELLGKGEEQPILRKRLLLR